MRFLKSSESVMSSVESGAHSIERILLFSYPGLNSSWLQLVSERHAHRRAEL